MSKRLGMAGFVAAAGMAVSMLAPTAAFAAETEIKVNVMSAHGSGCPTEDSVGVHVSPDNESFTLTYSEFEATGGSTKNCQLGLRVGVPAGFTFAIYKIDNRGYAYIKPGSTGKHVLTAYFTGESGTLVDRKYINYPYDDVWQSTTTAPVLHWASCDSPRQLNVNNILRVTGSEQSYMDLFSTDMDVSTIFHVKLKPC